MPLAHLCPNPLKHSMSGGFCYAQGRLKPLSIGFAPQGLDTLVTATEAAEDCGVSLSCIANWVKRGYLKASGLEGKRKLYRLRDVAEAERATRNRDRR